MRPPRRRRRLQLAAGGQGWTNEDPEAGESETRTMKWLAKNYDRLLLLAASLVALVFAVLMVKGSVSFKERFVQERPVKRSDIGETQAEEAELVALALEKENKWGVNLMPPNKPIHLNVSVPLVESDGGVFDMAIDDAALLREPVPNTWLLANRIRFLREDCLSLDPDEDGFSNLEEWQGSTNPQDAESHPPFTDKLFMADRFEVPYRLVFRGAIEPQFQVQRIEPTPRRSWFVKRQGNFEEEDRFTLIDYTEKRVEDERVGGSRDVSELLLVDNLWDEEFVLVKGEEKNLPTYYAIFDYRLKGKTQFQVKKGEQFVLPNDESTSYILVDVTEEGAAIRRVDAEDEAETLMIALSSRRESGAKRGSRSN